MRTTDPASSVRPVSARFAHALNDLAATTRGRPCPGERQCPEQIDEIDVAELLHDPAKLEIL